MKVSLTITPPQRAPFRIVGYPPEVTAQAFAAALEPPILELQSLGAPFFAELHRTLAAMARFSDRGAMEDVASCSVRFHSGLRVDATFDDFNQD